MKTIKELYLISKENETPLLSNYSGEWWADYVTNYTYFDSLFAKMFKTFVYYDQDSEETAEDIQEDFTDTVKLWLMMNDKRYSELYRINVIPDDDAYELTNNYDLHETYSGSMASNGASVTGQRTDVTFDNMGNQNTAGINKVTAFNSATENTDTSNEQAYGSKQDTHQFTKGQETDTNRIAGTDAHTLRRYGNIGVVDVDTMLQRHSNFWQLFNFYQMIFNDICKNYLLIGR